MSTTPTFTPRGSIVLVALSLSAGCSSRTAVTARNECIIAGDRILVHALIAATYRTGAVKASRDLWQFDCRLADKSCKGISLTLDNVDRGNPITMMNLNRLEGAELISMVGSVATIRWGPLRTFTIDFDQGKVTYIESGQNPLGASTEGRGEAACDVTRSTADQRAGQMAEPRQDLRDQGRDSDAGTNGFYPLESRVNCFTMSDPKLRNIDVCELDVQQCFERMAKLGVAANGPYDCREADSMACYVIVAGDRPEMSCYGDLGTCMLRRLDAEASHPGSTIECTEMRYVR